MIDISNILLAESAPTEPVTLAEAKAWLRVDYTDDDTLITSMIKSARQSIEHFTNRALVIKTVSLNAETPDDSFTSVATAYKLKLPYAKGSVVSLLILKDWEDTTLTVDTDYEVKAGFNSQPFLKYRYESNILKREQIR